MQGLSFSRYCELGLHCQATLKRCPTAVDYNFFIKQWVDGICSEWESQKAQMRYELSIRIDADELSFVNYNMLKVIARFQSIITDARVYIAPCPMIVNGVDAQEQYRSMISGTKQGISIMSATTEQGKTTDQKKHAACTNPHCEQKENHSTSYCTAYGGKNEGKWFANWSPRYKEKLQLQLNSKIKKLGPSSTTPVQTNTSSVMQEAGELSRLIDVNQLKQLIAQSEAEDKQQQLENKDDVEQNSTEIYQFDVDNY